MYTCLVTTSFRVFLDANLITPWPTLCSFCYNTSTHTHRQINSQHSQCHNQPTSISNICCFITWCTTEPVINLRGYFLPSIPFPLPSVPFPFLYPALKWPFKSRYMIRPFKSRYIIRGSTPPVGQNNICSHQTHSLGSKYILKCICGRDPATNSFLMCLVA